MMINSRKSKRLRKTKWGFYQYAPLPSEEELQEYYESKYYQEGCGSYEVNYAPEEIAYFKLKASLIYREVVRISKVTDKKTLLDIGCGEGWVMDRFNQSGVSVSGLDFSRFALEKFHPHLIQVFQQGNIYSLLKEIERKQKKIDYIICVNVIEHVIDPAGLLATLHEIMHPDSFLILTAPNDFSQLQQNLLNTKKISRKFWLSYPDHLSYFNKDSIEQFLSDFGFKIRSIVADNPIDLNLLNENSNYVEDQAKGKNTHLFRVRMDNFLASIDEEKLLSLYELLGSMGVGRDLTYYCQIYQ